MNFSAVLKWIFDVFYYVTDAFTMRSHFRTVLEKPGTVTINNSAFSNLSKLPVCGGKLSSSTNRHGAILVSCVKNSETTVTSKSNSDPNGAVISDNQPNGLLEKKSPSSATFPNGFEALLTEVCDETKIAELKLKNIKSHFMNVKLIAMEQDMFRFVHEAEIDFGPFQIHMKRNIDGPPVPAPVVPQITAPPVPSKPANASAPAAPPSPPKSSLEKVSPFTNVSIEKVAKLAAIEASGATGYVIVSSPTVGSFRRARTLKGKKQPPACKEGDVIKEGQVIGFLDQFGTQLPVRSGVGGEVLKLLYNDGEAVGYGDPLIAVLPSFHGIK
ncbi:UNVERIFIED_CONTAM: hypothetical protein Scaly_0506300 [Sesamum calycinum]|uniref:Lipoyl-binding domain-containing protein n=1 Tax=Sesamum calycinum TaxID=2727403 RepID=A0AAW2RPK8_9LAMI